MSTHVLRGRGFVDLLKCIMLPSTLLSYLVQWISTFHVISVIPYHAKQLDSNGRELTFELRHLHAHNGSRVLFSDVSKLQGILATKNKYTLRTEKVKIHKPRSHESFLKARWRSMYREESELLPWDGDEVDGPDVNDRETLLFLAKMTYNAYIEPQDEDWYDLGERWTDHYPFGWEPDADGFRGYVFATEDNSTVVLSIKGTSADFFGQGGPTSKKDKLNDNLLFSCCCARVGWSWTPVCDCYRTGYKCNIDCLQDALVEESLFYPIGTNLYNNLTYMYPDSDIWITGHSLGGALASLLGVTFGAPVVAFESPGEKMASTRLHLPQPPSTQHITHVYHTADPIAMGTCNGVFSTCANFGYAMESRCHLGKAIVFDTISNASWSSSIRTHAIATVIEKILHEPWPPSQELGREVPEAKPEEDCVECYNWEFGNFTNATNTLMH